MILIAGFIIQLLSAGLSVALKIQRRQSALVHGMFAAGLLVSVCGTAWMLLGHAPDISLPDFISADPLSLFFLFVIQLVSLPIVIYSYSYTLPYLENRQSVKPFLIFFLNGVFFTQTVVIVQHAVLFLVCWEFMALTSYLAMVFEKEKPEVQKGSWMYLVMTHISVLFLYVFFLSLYAATGSWLFTDYLREPLAYSGYHYLLIIGFIGFGIKAGFMPFHFWLPQAHPVAPTVLSAFLSGIIIKLGIYGILRMLFMIPPAGAAAGWIILGISMFSAIFGVWYALAQHDLKKLLAYHSIENIGIIGIGIGMTALGMAHHQPSLTALGMAGALLHTLNHAVFKTLLFIGSGVIYQKCHTRDIEKLGGIVHAAPVFVMLFVIGSVAISGLPPLNGFISEFIIYLSFFETAAVIPSFYPLFMLIMTVGLAFVGGLAVICFTKINSVMFLGLPRTERPALSGDRFVYAAMGFLAFMCVFIGLYPESVMALIRSVLAVNDWSIPPDYGDIFSSMRWVFLSVVLFMAGAVFMRYFLLKIRPGRVSKAWACGYRRLNPRMQYTASSYADEMNSLAARFLLYRKNEDTPKRLFPEPSRLESHTGDFGEDTLARPLYKVITRIILSLEWLNRTDIRYYVACILIILVVYTWIAFLWNL